jgi:FkbH-like protein
MSDHELEHLKTLRSLFKAPVDAQKIVAFARRHADDTSIMEALGQSLNRARQRGILSDSWRPLRCRIMASFNPGSFANLMVAQCALSQFLVATEETDYKQWFSSLMQGSTSRDEDPEFQILLFDDSVVFERVRSAASLDEIKSAIDLFLQELEQALHHFRSHSDHVIGMTSLVLSPRHYRRLIGIKERQRLSAMWHELNRRLHELAERHSNTLILDMDQVSSKERYVSENRRLYAGQIFSLDFLADLSRAYRQLWEALLGRSKKCIIVDLDHTLWGGVLGDDGMDGVLLGGLYPGNAYKELQGILQVFREQGVLLAICSKNDSNNVLQMLREHDEQILREGDFACIKANWSPKSSNIQSIAQSLNLGLDAMVFLDDSSFERQEVAFALPELQVLEPRILPDDFAALLLKDVNVLALTVTQEDRARTALYRSESQRQDLLQASPSYEDFLYQIGLQLKVRRMHKQSLGRVVQLFQRTNQFNVSGRRYTEAELTKVEEQGGAVYCAELIDRYGSSGLIAAAVLKPGSEDGALLLENMVLSCRVFNRGVEQAFLAKIWQELAGETPGRLIVPYVPTKKNGRVRDFLTGLKFEEQADHHYAYQRPEPLQNDSWITYI